MSEKKIYSALHKYQKAPPKIQKKSINPHFKSKYAALDDIIPIVLPELNKYGLVLTQEPSTTEDGTVTVITRLTHADTGENISCSPSCVTDGTAQKVGSAITYLRRYGFSLVGLVTDDDEDGAVAQRGGGTEEKKLGKKELQKKILDICMTIAGGDDEQAPGVLEELTHWEKDGEVKRQGLRKGQDLIKLSEPALKTIYGNAKKALDAWEKARGPISMPEPDFTLEGGSEEAFALEASIRELGEALGKKTGDISKSIKKCSGDVVKLKAHHAQLVAELESANGDKS